DQSLSMAIERIDPRHRGSVDGKPLFIIMGMGRLGGEELSFNSDLDLLFVYEIPQKPHSGREVMAPEYFVRLAQRFISMLSVPMAHGLGYRVDMRLRPSGTVGPLVVSMESFRDYYRNEARLWERQALIRARVVAGHPELGERVMREVHRFAYEEPLPAGAAGEIRRMRHRMEIELARESEGHFNLKTGSGGLVDVEFAVQYLQLKYGGEQPLVREPNTLKAMGALGKAGILAGDDLHVLMAGYEYLRRVETHLRLLHDFSTDELRFDSEAAERIARGLGYESKGGVRATDAMREEYGKVTRDVRDVYERVVV
ncbi:MAG: bifunctional [glutamate--ammonia ligase]-adenylyl-L-tyrosine phosphorylase/[glutamate--ammonia-ligase] adenylyltransferase, partial [Deltaproteobacteria bacterium]|nr:bifunctional [glutamate--ammonia ligase]-adenylyl-L-tyrosine phosphorylase/[glutamate--ammonia-ligase] adenylyltransferase [Deltaproteobacteria bacterium]